LDSGTKSLKKAEKTSTFIIERVAPYFNKHGYTGTSLSDICKATGLTKGAIYGNFKDKEELAIKAFNYTVKRALGNLGEQLSPEESGLSKLFRVTNYYRNYYDHVYSFGG
jgi:TetR/AcrR family transcriptional repressor of nem operon